MTLITASVARWEIRLAERELRANGVLIPLGSRAFDILEVLVRARGTLVTKEELFRRVWNRAIVEDNTLQVHISALRKALREDRAWLKTASGRGYRLLGTWIVTETPVTGLRARPPAAESMPSISRAGESEGGNLPMAGTTLIGRDAAIRQAQDFVTAYRIVTFVGLGGIGKTRLALEVARCLMPKFRNDVWLVELAALADPRLVSSTVAQTLRLDLNGNESSYDNVARAIGNRKLLLVLDNCEHVIDTAAALAETIVRKSPSASILATSREALRIEGEHIFRVTPLDVPSPQGATDPLRHSAVALFVAKMQEHHAGFVPDSHGLADIATICRRLDGIPLALELAAARASMFGLGNVVSRLNGRFGLLTDGRRTALPRHQTLQATFDWSWQLLSDSERSLLRWMAVFPGGFTLDAATAIMGRAGVAASAVVNDVGNLVAKSLLYLDDAGPATIWRMLETTRAYAVDKLNERGDARIAAQHHAEFFRDLLQSSWPMADAEAADKELERKGHHIDNVRVALDWCFSDDGDPAIGVQLTAAYAPVWLYRSLMAECRARIERALQDIPRESALSPHLAIQLHVALGIALMHTTGLVERTRVALMKALEIADMSGDADTRLRALWALWEYHSNCREFAIALQTAEKFARLSAQSADPASAVVSNRLMGHSLHYRGSQAEARNYCERALDTEGGNGRRRIIWFQYDQRILVGTILARVLWLMGSPDKAAAVARAQCRDAAESDHKLSLCYALTQAAYPIAVVTGDLAAAEEAWAMCRETATSGALSYYRSWSRCLEGALLIRRGAAAAGLSILRDGLGGLGKVGRRQPELQLALADGLASDGQIPEALAVVSEALAHARRGGDQWCVPELHRVKGELLLRQGNGDATVTARRHFLAALGVARSQGALSWELRIALSLARLEPRLSLRDESYQGLAAVYDRFKEGFATSDVRRAQRLLQDVIASRA